MKTKVEDKEEGINVFLGRKVLPKGEMIKDVIGYCSAYISDQIGNINTDKNKKRIGGERKDGRNNRGVS